MSLDESQVEAALGEIKDPETGRSVTKTNQIQGIQIDGQDVVVTLGLTTHSAPLWEETKTACAEHLRAKLPTADSVNVELAVHDRPATPIGQIGLTAKSVIAIGSGKGGVGKSTVASSVALALKRFGCSVGLMDADVYGPSIPHLLGISDAGRPAVSPENKIQPILAGDLPVMSMGFLVPADEAVVWRGPMLHGAITQFLRDTHWGNLDYLIIDMPPGTGDIALTLSQSLPLTGAVVVCTPQDVALLDAVKAIVMFRKVNIKVLGMVENMSGFVCPDCNKRYDIFGSGGATERANKMDVPVLGEVPITIAIREHGDAGKTDALFDQPHGEYFRDIATKISRQLSESAAKDPPMPQLPVLG